MKFNYFNVDKRLVNEDINTLFPDFGKEEVLAVMSPHDDDAIIGAGYAMLAAKEAGADVYVVIYCRGDAGYSTVEEKDTIEKVRVEETYACYERMGIDRDHIIRLNFADFSAIGYYGWALPDGTPGEMQKMLRFLRDKKVTRVMIPNHYHEHIDHLAAHIMSSYDAPQAGDCALVDHGTPHAVKSTLEYSVWADLDPEDALVNSRPSNIRANRILSVSSDVEGKIADAISAYASQQEIIKGLIDSRKERMTANGNFIEIYISFDCRPKLDFSPYIEWVEEMTR
ncbi:MAG: PIG-L family deacetylase [Oscillospiraceae bacterium]|nr:PIG-L family deacetylase [Oscillospiraceae bacterium]